MHNRAEARYDDLVAEVVADLRRGDRAGRSDAGVAAGLDSSSIPGIGFGKTAGPQPRAPARARRACASWGGRSCSGTSRKSTLGKVLDLPADQRLEATLATTALGHRRRRRHRARPRRPRERAGGPDGRRDRPRWRPDRWRRGRGIPERPDRPRNMRFEGRHGVHDAGAGRRRSRSRWTSSSRSTCQPAGPIDDLAQTVDYGRVFETCRQIVESDDVPPDRGARRGDRARDPRRASPVDEVTVRVRKPEVRLGGPLDYAGVEIRRRRSTG